MPLEMNIPIAEICIKNIVIILKNDIYKLGDFTSQKI